MRKHFKLLTLATLLVATLPARASDSQLVFLCNGQNRVFNIADVSRVTFGESGLTVSAATMEEFPYETLQRVVFDYDGTYDDTNAISAVTSANGRKFVYNSRLATIAFKGFESEATPVEIYSATGMRAMSVPAYKDGTIDVSALAPGIYIVKTKTSSTKFIKK